MKHESSVVTGVNIFGFFIILYIGIQKCCAIEVKTMDKDMTCTMTLNECKVVPPDPGQFMALDGLPGQKGENGEIGAQGPKGDNGLHGLPGIKGEQGLQGPKGDKGDTGEEGPAGHRGIVGASGLNGIPGLKGERGQIGPSGMPGEDGSCPGKCELLFDEEVNLDEHEETRLFGTYLNPSDAPCSGIRDIEESGKAWVYRHDKFKVDCNEGWTCLPTVHKTVTYIEDNAFYSPANQNTSFWLSNTFAFNLTEFYGVNMKQIAWLQQKSMQVTQTIRYHCKNSYVMDNPETALRLLSANDVAFGPYVSDSNPIAYTIFPNATHGCKEGASKSVWLYSDITVHGNTNRLPVNDFFIKDNRNEEQSFFLELVELCFK